LLFIARDLAVLKAVSDRVAVMDLGRLCDVGSSEQLFAKPAHRRLRPLRGLLLSYPLPEGGPAMYRRGAGASPRGAAPVRRLPSSIDRDGLNL
jgi:ABC-type dipeptide/oligopeptide/nickel transport system ATPase component